MSAIFIPKAYSQHFYVPVVIVRRQLIAAVLSYWMRELLNLPSNNWSVKLLWQPQ